MKYNKCIGDDTKAAAGQSPNCIKNKNKIKYGEKRFSIDVIAEEADRSLFAKMAGSQHCLQTLLPDIKPYSCRLRPKGRA